MSPTNQPTTVTSLLPLDFEMFAKLGIIPDLLAKAGVERVTGTEARENFGIKFALASDLSGIIFPYYHPKVKWRVGSRLRRDHPELDDGGKPINKYLCAYGDSRHLYFPPDAAEKLRAPDTIIVLVESEKAALALTAWAERRDIKLLALAMGGSFGWKTKRASSDIAPNGERIDIPGPLDDLNYCNDRKVYILLDANTTTNEQVRMARTELIVELNKAERNSTLLVCDLPSFDGVNGPDDHIGTRGDDAMAEVFAKVCSPADRSVGGALEWLNPEPLGNELPPVPTFDPVLLPNALRPWCQDISRRFQVPLDLPACATIAALGAACMRRVMVQPKRLDSGWVVVPIIWGAVVGEPGTKKTPTINAIYQPLHKIEASWIAKHKVEIADTEIAAEQFELKKQVYREEYKRFCKGGGKVPEPARLEKPAEMALRRKRLIATDVTYEALSEILAYNPSGSSILRDELAGWLQSFERQNREADRAFFLECWGGHSPFSSSRIGRGDTDVEHCAVGVFGGIQPNRLRWYLGNVQQEDGLFQRFQLLVWPDYPQDSSYVDVVPDDIALQNATEVFARIAAMDGDTPLVLKFTSDAQGLFEELLPQIDCRAMDANLPAVVRAHFAKYRSLMPSIALLLSIADGRFDAISLQHAQMAAAWCEFLALHALRVYAAQVSPEMIAAQLLSRKLSLGWKRAEGCFSLRDVYRPQWAGLTSPEEARLALDVLSEYDWVRKVQIASVGAGRPSEVYRINPGIWKAK